jgi:hypothetical protein
MGTANIMTEENQQKLFNRFNFFHPKKTLHNSLMGFGFECGDGWFKLIWKLCEDLEKLNLENEKRFEVIQVKEKFGGLRFYTHNTPPKMRKRILKAIKQSHKICENCGNPGKERVIRFWFYTLCDLCYKKLKKSKEK